jgi:hypothetical protein
MSLNNNISRKIKVSFETDKEKAPEFIWGRIDKSLQDKAIDKKIKTSFEEETLKAPGIIFPDLSESKFNIDKKISESFESQRNVLPNSVWNNLETKLDINHVWNKVSAKIKINNFSRTKFAIASFIIGFISLLPPTELKNQWTEHNIANFSYKNKDSFILKNKLINSSSTKNTLIAQNIIPSANPIKKLKSEITEDTQTLGKNKVNITIKEYKNQLNYDKIKHIVTPIHFISQKSFDKLIPNEISMPDISAKQSKFRIGLIISLNNTWINNNETRSAFDKNSLITSKMAYGSSKGVTADYYFNDKFGVSTTFLIQSRIKNKIAYYDNGLYKLKTTEINYSKGVILFNYSKNIISKRLTKRYIFSAGPYLAYNKGSSIISGETITSFNSSYKKIDYGLKLQIGKEHQWSSFVFGYGLNSDIGARDILLNNGNLDASNNNYTSNFNSYPH